MSFGSGPRPKPIEPGLVPVEAGGAEFQEIQRRKSAMARSPTLFSRGLLFQSPSLLYPKLFGKMKLGE